MDRQKSVCCVCFVCDLFLIICVIRSTEFYRNCVCVTLIYLFKKDYFIANLQHIFGYFIYTSSLKFFLYKKTSIQQTELA